MKGPVSVCKQLYCNCHIVLLLLQFLNALNVQSIGETTFFKHQSKLLFPTIYWQWCQEQIRLISDTKAAGDVILGGDMRADSPGEELCCCIKLFRRSAHCYSLS